MLHHAASCNSELEHSSSQQKLQSYCQSTSDTPKPSNETKRKITLAAVKVCAKDLRPFEVLQQSDAGIGWITGHWTDDFRDRFVCAKEFNAELYKTGDNIRTTFLTKAVVQETETQWNDKVSWACSKLRAKRAQAPQREDWPEF
uniref:Uncharacterized protein n=1 Tax=Romanomermis culicivorax TaxID=13658 RepID=A0A915K6V9_ROMCU